MAVPQITPSISTVIGIDTQISFLLIQNSAISAAIGGTKNIKIEKASDVYQGIKSSPILYIQIVGCLPNAYKR